MNPLVVLIILDGWGIGRPDPSNPIHLADLKNFKWLEANFPVTSLQASGISVGLPWGETSNSEVGHLTIGSGKVVYQYFPRIILSIREGSFFKNQALVGAFDHARKNNSAVNVVGLLTKGNVHASVEHLKALIQMGEQEKIRVKLHLFSDGKDTPPHSFDEYIRYVPTDKLVTLIGRYYAMDHNGNYKLTKKAYDTLVGQEGEIVSDYKESIQHVYNQNLTEEFLPPVRFTSEIPISDGESLIFFNFREDGMRQLSEAFILDNFDKFAVKKFQNLHIVTMTSYEDQFNVPVAFLPDNVSAPLGKVISDHGLTQMRLSETYKYAHVTYFFNGGIEKPFRGEDRILIPSPKVSSYDKAPEMSTPLIAKKLLEIVNNKLYSLVVVNFANADMVAHTGNIEATVSAVKSIDYHLGILVNTVLSAGGGLIITADHGNAEEMISLKTGQPDTEHNLSPVPAVFIFKELQGINQQLPQGLLADISPTVLSVLQIPKPSQMTGRSLL